MPGRAWEGGVGASVGQACEAVGLKGPEPLLLVRMRAYQGSDGEGVSPLFCVCGSRSRAITSRCGPCTRSTRSIRRTPGKKANELVCSQCQKCISMTRTATAAQRKWRPSPLQEVAALFEFSWAHCAGGWLFWLGGWPYWFRGQLWRQATTQNRHSGHLPTLPMRTTTQNRIHNPLTRLEGGVLLIMGIVKRSSCGASGANKTVRAQDLEARLVVIVPVGVVVHAPPGRLFPTAPKSSVVNVLSLQLPVCFPQQTLAFSLQNR